MTPKISPVIEDKEPCSSDDEGGHADASTDDKISKCDRQSDISTRADHEKKSVEGVNQSKFNYESSILENLKQSQTNPASDEKEKEQKNPTESSSSSLNQNRDKCKDSSKLDSAEVVETDIKGTDDDPYKSDVMSSTDSETQTLAVSSVER